MKRLWTILALSFTSLAALSAQADEQGAHWHVVGFNEQVFMTTNIHAARTLDDGTKLIQSAMYLPSTRRIGDGSVDFVTTVEQIDCSTPYRYRTVFSQGFKANVEPAVFERKNTQEPWTIAQKETLGAAKWSMACEGIPEKTALNGITTHEQVLAQYRDTLSPTGAGSSLPAEAQQILRDATL